MREINVTPTSATSKWPVERWVWILLPLQVGYVFYVVFYVQHHGMLPAPFFYNAFDSFMDFFATNFWAFHQGRYDDWKSVYPILVFALAKLFTPPSYGALDPPSALRAWDIDGVLFLLASYVAGAACARMLAAHLTEHGARWQDWLGWFIVIALSIPGLFAMERGNYIVIAFLFLALAAYYEGNWKSALFLALAINIKQYLAVLWIVPLLQQRYDLVVISVVFVILPSIAGLIFRA
jgi:hypothetical protein